MGNDSIRTTRVCVYVMAQVLMERVFQVTFKNPFQELTTTLSQDLCRSPMHRQIEAMTGQQLYQTNNRIKELADALCCTTPTLSAVQQLHNAIQPPITSSLETTISKMNLGVASWSSPKSISFASPLEPLIQTNWVGFQNYISVVEKLLEQSPRGHSHWQKNQSKSAKTKRSNHERSSDDESCDKVSPESLLITPESLARHHSEDNGAIWTPDTDCQIEVGSFFSVDKLMSIASSPEEIYKIDGIMFEFFTAELISRLGFENVIVTPRSNDKGRDVIAERRELGQKLKFNFQCKHSKNRQISRPEVLALLGCVVHEMTLADRGILMTTSRFSKAAQESIDNDARLEGRDFDSIVKMLREYRRIYLY